jgi:hypothetical protein
MTDRTQDVVVPATVGSELLMGVDVDVIRVDRFG